MNKQKATLLLARELAKENHIYLIDNPKAQEYLKENSISFLPIMLECRFNEVYSEGHAEIEHEAYYLSDRYEKEGKKVWVRTRPKYDDETKIEGIDAGKSPYYSDIISPCCEAEDKLLKQHALGTAKEKFLNQAKEIGANYIFDNKSTVRSEYSDTECFAKLRGFPYAIITENEIDLLKDAFKGDLSDKVREAIKELGISEKKLHVDYVKLSKNDPEKFKEYFGAVSEKKQKSVIKSLYNLKQVNPAINSWLEKDYHKLVEEVGRDRLVK